MRFCKEKIEPIDKVWTKRLEDKGSESEEEEEDKYENVIKSDASDDTDKMEL